MIPWEVASLDPRDMVGRINVEDHQTLLHIKSVSAGPHGFREEYFWRFFSYIALYIHMTPCGVASLEPRGLTGRIYVGDHCTLLHNK